MSRHSSLARKWRFSNYLCQCLEPLSSSGVDMFLIETALIKLLSVSNITNRYLWPWREVTGITAWEIGSNQVLDFLADAVLMMSTATRRVWLNSEQVAGGNVGIVRWWCGGTDVFRYLCT